MPISPAYTFLETYCITLPGRYLHKFVFRYISTGLISLSFLFDKNSKFNFIAYEKEKTAISIYNERKATNFKIWLTFPISEKLI